MRNKSMLQSLVSAVAVQCSRCLLLGFAALTPVRGDQLNFAPFVLETSDGKRINAESARLSVPERHSQPTGRQIEIALVRVKSSAKNPGPPIVYLAGGPGGSGITIARGPRSPVILAMREVADVIALDQRGTGLSQPDVTCRETLAYPLDRPAQREALLQFYKKALNKCVERLRANGVDLAAYNTEENADDLESLRQALGVKKISLFGSSYGTHLGLAALRRNGDKIHRAIFSGIEGPEHTLKLPSNVQQDLARVSELVQSHERISEHIPDLMALIAHTQKQIDSKPVTIRLANTNLSVTIGKFDLQQVTLGLLGTREGKSSIPALYYGLSVGSYSSPAVQAMARDIVGQRTGPIGSAMGFAMDCASGASATRRRMIEEQSVASLLGGDIDFPIPQICAACGLPELPDSFRAPFGSDVPTLLLSGTLDGRTPPANAEEVRRGLRNSWHIFIDGAGHGNELFLSSPAIRTVMLEFMKTGQVATNTIMLPPIEFKEFPTANPEGTR